MLHKLVQKHEALACYSLLMKEADNVFLAILCHKSGIIFLAVSFWPWHKMAKSG